MADVVDLPALLAQLQGFPPLQRVLLATAGTLQGTLSAYFGAPVTVDVVSQSVRGDSVHREVAPYEITFLESLAESNRRASPDARLPGDTLATIPQKNSLADCCMSRPRFASARASKAPL